MANLDSTQDIKRQVLKNCGEMTDGNSRYDEDGTVLGYIWDAYLKVLGASSPYDIDVGEPWAWAKAKYPLILTLLPKYNSGSVALTVDSTAGTFSTPPTGLGSFANRILKVDGRPEYIRIASHTADAGPFVLDANYNNATGTGLSFLAYPLDYDVGNAQTNRILRICGPAYTESLQSNPDDDGAIYFLDQRRFRREYPFQNILEGIPTAFTEIAEADGVRTIRFNRYPISKTRVEIDYIPEPAPLMDSSDSVPIIPLEHRCVLEYAATYRLMIDKEDDRAAQYLSMTQAELKSMMAGKRKENHQAASQQRGQLVPRPDLRGDRRTDFRFRR